MTQSLRRADASNDIALDWMAGLNTRVVADTEDAAERTILEALLDAEGQPDKLDAEWLNVQALINQAYEGPPLDEAWRDITGKMKAIYDEIGPPPGWSS